MEHLRSIGLDFEVYVALAGEMSPLDYIIATKGGKHFGGPPPEVVEGKDEDAIREFLEANGDTQTSLA